MERRSRVACEAEKYIARAEGGEVVFLEIVITLVVVRCSRLGE